MKATGVVRPVDPLGRVVIPIELRRTYNISKEDSLEIFVDPEGIFLKKYEPSCIFCGEAKEVKHIKGKNICQGCVVNLKNYNSDIMA